MTEWTKEEDEAFNEVEKHSNLGKQILRANKSSGMDCCTYDCTQGRNCPVRKELSPYEAAMGWRKRQMVKSQIKNNEVIDKIRNDTLEEVAIEFDNLKIAFGDTAHSFSRFVRDMKT
jgi:hypothetical protein